MLVKISNKFFVFIPDSHSLGTFLDDRNQETIDHPVKILKDLFLADMAVYIDNKRFVILNRMKDVQKPLLPCIICGIIR
jgi:hypothetical protein